MYHKKSDKYRVIVVQSQVSNYSAISWKEQVTYTVKSLLFIGYQFSWVGWSTKLSIQRTIKLGKELDIDILANAVLEWPQLAGPAALGSSDNYNDEISTGIPFNGL